MNLNQVTVPSVNVEKAADFYSRLGLRLIVEAYPRYARFECPEGDSTFSIHQVARLPEGEGTLVYFECEQLDEKITELQDRGIPFESLAEDKKWLWRETRLKDPDGNRIVLYWGGKNRKDPPWRVRETK
jgi:catechol 2,3-dioxygenase-like lactoylglutathione lyase family enzyme